MKNHKLMVPVSIIISGLLISAVFYFQNKPNASQEIISSGVIDIRPIDQTDHILGNPRADIIIIEYVDTSCPACRSFHDTLKAIMLKYGDTGQVALVHRHLPIDSLHPNAKREALALECVAEIGGKSKFWVYLENLYAAWDRGPVGPQDLIEMAQNIGIKNEELNSCLDSGKYKNKVEEDIKEALRIGAMGTPYTVIISIWNDKKAIFQDIPSFEILDATIGSLLHN